MPNSSPSKIKNETSRLQSVAFLRSSGCIAPPTLQQTANSARRVLAGVGRITSYPSFFMQARGVQRDSSGNSVIPC